VDFSAEALARPRVFSNGDGNIANYLCSGHKMYVVDFENAGYSTLEFELAELMEHVSFLPYRSHYELFSVAETLADSKFLMTCRRLQATWWLQQLQPGGRFHLANPPEWTVIQSTHLAALLME